MKTNKRKGRKTMWIAILIILGIIVLIVCSVRVGLSVTKHEYSAKPELMKSTSSNSNKALVIYQPSITSASSDVAHSIAKGLNSLGYEVTLNTPGKHLSSDISSYFIVVFGSPNYGGSPAEPMLNYIKRIDDFTDKRVLLFSTSGSKEGRLEFDKIESLLHGIKPYKTIKLVASESKKNKEVAYQFGVDAGEHAGEQ